MTSTGFTAQPRFSGLLTRDTLALVLAGGRGTRLGALTHHRVKPAVPFGGKYRLIDFPLSNCINSGIRRVGVLTQYKAQSLITHLHGAWNFLPREFYEFVDVLPAQQRTGPGWYEGTADAVFQNLDFIEAHAPQFVLILGGDHVYKMDYGAMLGYHVDRQADVTVACIEVPLAEARAFGVMHTDGAGRVIDFREKPEVPPPIPARPDRALASMGVYVFNTDFLLRILARDRDRAESSHDFGHDVIPDALSNDDSVYAFPFRDLAGNALGYWRDVGTLDSYWRANLELTQVTPALNVYDRHWPIWTYQVQAPPAKFILNERDRRGMAVDSMIAGGCVISGGLVERSLLFPFSRVEEGAEIDECVILPEVRIGPRSRIRRAVIESGCEIPSGTVIGHNEADDRSRFEVSEGGITLVTPEMLGQEPSIGEFHGR